MKFFRFFIAPLLLATLVLPAGLFLAPKTAQAGPWDRGVGQIGGSPCAGGTCGLPRPGGVPGAGSAVGNVVTSGAQAAAGPVVTIPGPGLNVNIGNPIVGIGSAVLNAIAASTATATGQKLFEWGQTFVLEALKKRILDMMVAEIIRWIQGGEEPRFITDWQGFLEDAGNVAVGEFISGTPLASLCQPFRDQIKLGLTPEQNANNFGNRAACTLDDIVGNLEDYADNFSNGGWLGYQTSWEAQNNLFGSWVMARSQANRVAASAKLAAQNEALSGGGFTSPKSCRETIGGTGPDLDKDGIKGDIAESCGIVTPGSVVEELTKRAVTADIDFVINANQLSTYLAAIADAAFNRLIRDGVAGLKGLTTDDAPTGGSIPNGPTSCLSFPSGSTLRNACDAYSNSNDANFEATLAGALGDIESARRQYVIAQDNLEASIIAATDFLVFLDDEPARCTDQTLIDQVTLKITELKENLDTVKAIIVDLDEAPAMLNAVASGDWADFTRVMNNIRGTIDFLAASDVAQATRDQLEAINEDIQSTKNDLLLCF